MAVSNKTYNNVINTLLRLGEYHEQISTTSVGDIFDINLEKMELFPLMHVNPVSVTTGDAELIYNFQIFICDLVSEKSEWQTEQHSELTKLVDTKTNEQEVFNQTLEIATDFIGMLRHSSRQSLAGVNNINEPLYFTEGQFTLEPFQERFDNLLCGYVFQIGIKVMNDFDTCIIPVTAAGAAY
tara:strand:- start:114 stop:662 length:549 start_codon:yes stop_codon:yes gene_type:complete